MLWRMPVSWQWLTRYPSTAAHTVPVSSSCSALMLWAVQQMLYTRLCHWPPHQQPPPPDPLCASVLGSRVALKCD